MNVYVYIVFHVFTDGTREVCGVFCKPDEAKRHCDQHPALSGVQYFAVAQVPLWGFPWVLLLAFVALAAFVGHLL